jgi:hypothetical protein
MGCGDKVEAMLSASLKLIPEMLQHAPSRQISHSPVGVGTVLGFALMALPGAIVKSYPEVRTCLVFTHTLAEDGLDLFG